MKKMLRLLAAMMLVACMSIGLSSAVFAACYGDAAYNTITIGETLTVACEHGVNLRSYPSTVAGQSKVYTSIPAKANVYVMSNKLANFPGWIYVTYGDVSGYVATSDSAHGNLFSHMKASETVVEYDMTKDPSVKYTAKVTASTLNVRSGYYITKPIVGYLTLGQAVEAIANTSNGWVKVRYYSGSKQIVGYVSGTYVTLTKGSAQPTPDPSKAGIDDDTSFSALVGCVGDSASEADLTVYASPKSYAGVKAKLDEAEMVYINAKAKNGMWYQVSFYDRGDEDDEDDEDIYDGSNALMQTGYVKASDVYVYRVFDKLKLPSKKLTLSVGKKKTFKVVDKYRFFSDVRLFGVTVKYKTSNKSVATITKNGVLRAKKPGKTVISATVSIGSGVYKRTRKLDSCVVTVK